MRHLAVRLCILLAGVLMGTQGMAAIAPHAHHSEDPCAICQAPNPDRRKKSSETAKREDLQSFDPSLSDASTQASEDETQLSISTFAFIAFPADSSILLRLPWAIGVQREIPDGPDPHWSHPLCLRRSPRAPPYA